MLFRLRPSNASPLIGALLAIAALLSPSFAFAQTGPFADLEGAWTGKGVISASDGHSEPIRCRAKYYVSPSGRDLDQQLRCASDTYRFDVNSGLVRQANGEILGRWTETNRNASGSVNARERSEERRVGKECRS